MDLKAPVHTVDFVAFDFETTGLNPATDRIVEFGAVQFRNGEVLATYSELASPGIPIGPEAGRVSGISDEDVRGCPPVGDLLPGFVAFLGSAVLIAHNAPFDLGFLRAAMQRAGMPPIDNHVIDTQLLSMRAYPRRKSYSLQNLARELTLPKSTAHRARDDSELCMRLFLSCVDSLSFMGDLELGEVLTTRPAG